MAAFSLMVYHFWRIRRDGGISRRIEEEEIGELK